MSYWFASIIFDKNSYKESYFQKLILTKSIKFL
jgi:hypothetical protein